MFEVKGKYNTATIYTENIEEAAYSQVLNLMIGTGKPEWGAEPGKEYFVITWSE